MQAIEEQMQQLIGLQEVKDSLEELKIYIDNRMKRAEKGNQSEIVSVHFLFKGNPGTGKTTIARMVANYLKAVGYLTEGQLIEVDRSNLVGEYVGHTATKTMNKIKAAMGGVLFIDEAYSLARGEEEDFGREAIDTIVKAMEDYKGKFVVIFAGYPKEIDELLEVNPGLLSRITQTFYFSDYSSEELVDIANGIAHSQGYMIDSEALDRLIQKLWIDCQNILINIKLKEKLMPVMVDLHARLLKMRLKGKLCALATNLLQMKSLIYYV